MNAREKSEAERLRRRRRIEAGICIVGDTHGPATHGVRCERCHQIKIGLIRPGERAIERHESPFAAHACRSCGSAVTPPNRSCDACVRKPRRRASMCKWCGVEPRAKYQQGCRSCLEAKRNETIAARKAQNAWKQYTPLDELLDAISIRALRYLSRQGWVPQVEISDAVNPQTQHERDNLATHLRRFRLEGRIERFKGGRGLDGHFWYRITDKGRQWLRERLASYPLDAANDNEIAEHDAELAKYGRSAA